MSTDPRPAAPLDTRRLRRVVLVVAALNLAYFVVEAAVALAAGSVALLADSVDFLEDTAINLLIALALGWSVRRRAAVGRLMVLVLFVPAAAAAWAAVQRLGDPRPPEVTPVVLASLGAVVVNGASALLLTGIRRHGGSLTAAAFLSARNDVLVNVAVIVMGVVTAATGSGWPDLVLGVAIIALGLHAAWEVWEASEDERLAARALAGETID